MALSSLINAKLNRLESVPDALISTIDRQKITLLQKLVENLNSLDVSKGNIVASAANLRKVELISQLMKEALFEGEYLEAVKQFAKEFGTQAVLNNKIFAERFTFEEKELYRQTLRNSQKNALLLLEETAIDNSFINPLRNILDNSVKTSTSFGSVVKSLNEYIIGSPTAEPRLTRYAKQVAHDAFAVSDRSYMSVISNDLGIEKWEYSGGLLKDSRQFCLERAGKVFEKKEIESWAALDWQGKVRGTNEGTIFSFLGGYNCIHSLIPTM